MKHTLRTTAGLAALAGLALAGLARAEELTKAEQVLDKYVQATGGKEAHEKLKNLRAEGTFELPAAGIKGTFVLYQAEPNKMHTEIDLPGVGKIEKGTDGEVVWEKSAIQGPRILKGEERAASLRDSLWNGAINWRKAYEKADLQGTEDVEGKPCYKVVLTAPGGETVTQWYEKASGLLVKSSMVVRSSMGNLPVTSFTEDYKKVDGVLFSHKTRQQVLGNEIVVTITKIAHNVQLPKDRFELPEEIKKLAEKEKKSG
jgi:hypothetical protein